MRLFPVVSLFVLALTAGCTSTAAGKCANCERAQSVVASIAAQNPDCTRLTLHCTMGDGMKTCASTDAARIGRPSDPEDLQAVQTAQVVVLDEGGAFDVTVPINARGGKPKSACGVTLGAGMTREAAVAKAKTIAMAVEAGVAECGDCCCK